MEELSDQSVRITKPWLRLFPDAPAYVEEFDLDSGHAFLMRSAFPAMVDSSTQRIIAQGLRDRNVNVNDLYPVQASAVNKIAHSLLGDVEMAVYRQKMTEHYGVNQESIGYAGMGNEIQCGVSLMVITLIVSEQIEKMGRAFPLNLNEAGSIIKRSKLRTGPLFLIEKLEAYVDTDVDIPFPWWLGLNLYT